MKKIKLIELYKFLKYMHYLTPRRIWWAVKTRYYCNRFHNQWWENSLVHGAGKYNYTGYECQKCNAYHYEFKVNTTVQGEQVFTIRKNWHYYPAKLCEWLRRKLPYKIGKSLFGF